MKYIHLGLLLVLISGCTAFTPPRERPLLTEQFEAKDDVLESFGVAATDANRRVAIIDILSGQICVEPPPEAANTISEAFSALLEANVKDQGDLGASLSQSISQNISQLYRRTQTVQLYRDAVFALCQSAINGTVLIDASTKAIVQPDLREKIATEIKALGQDDFYKLELSDLEEKGFYSTKTLDALSIRRGQLESQKNVDQAKKVEALVTSLGDNLKRAEFRRRLEDGLREAFDVLKEELPQFYETEKLRFIVELGKPVHVCNTDRSYYENKEAEDGDEAEERPLRLKSEKVTCKAKVPQGIEKVISEYAKTLQATETNKASQ